MRLLRAQRGEAGGLTLKNNFDGVRILHVQTTGCVVVLDVLSIVHESGVDSDDSGCQRW